jgi:cytochrome b involved in lipid metabolism
MAEVTSRGLTVVRSHVYDLREFANEHGGGRAVIESLRGKDGTRSFDQNHVFEPSRHPSLARFRVGTIRK